MAKRTLECQGCGISFVQEGRGRNRKWCFDCSPPAKAAGPHWSTFDPVCSAPLRGRTRAATGTKAGYLRHWKAGEEACIPCRAASNSYAHKQRGQLNERTCEWCGAMWCNLRRGAPIRYCSEGCFRSRTNWWLRTRDYPTVRLECSSCGVAFERRRKDVYDDGTPYCSYDCYNESRARDESAAPRGYISPSVRLAIYERDGWECQLCGEVVDRDADGRDPMAPSIDHVLPVSRGGSDHEWNLQTAHLSCNVRRGNDLLDGQLGLPFALVG